MKDFENKYSKDLKEQRIMIIKLMKEIKGISSKSPTFKRKNMLRNQTVNLDELKNE